MKFIICDDDPNQRDSIRVCLEVSAARNEFAEFELGSDALDYLESNQADFMFLDMGLPDMDGLEVLKQVRKSSDLPVIVVSGNDTTDSVVKALALGADDYITKPFEQIELMARVESVTRRAAGRKVEHATFTAHGMLFDFDRKHATVDNEKIDLNLTEWDVMKALLIDPGVVVEYSTLKEHAWGNADVSDAAVHMAIRRLRQKLKQDSSESEQAGLIRSHRGIGYSISSN
ncbi:MAG: response regulator transcription factor [Dehalococcoidia bacterium]